MPAGLYWRWPPRSLTTPLWSMARQGYRASRHQNLADMTLYGDALGLGGGSDKCRGGVARTIFPSTLSSCSQNRPPYCAFSGLGDCPNNIILSFPSPEKTSTLIYEGIPQVGLLLIHCAECEHQSSLSALCTLWAAQFLPSWSESPRLSWSTRRSWERLDQVRWTNQ